MYYKLCFYLLRKVCLYILIQDGRYRYTFVSLTSLGKSQIRTGFWQVGLIILECDRQSRTKFLLGFWFHDRVSRLLNLYCCDYSAKDVADWYRHNTMYYVSYIVSSNPVLNMNYQLRIITVTSAQSNPQDGILRALVPLLS